DLQLREYVVRRQRMPGLAVDGDRCGGFDCCSYCHLKVLLPALIACAARKRASRVPSNQCSVRWPVEAARKNPVCGSITKSSKRQRQLYPHHVSLVTLNSIPVVRLRLSGGKRQASWRYPAARESHPTAGRGRRAQAAPPRSTPGAARGVRLAPAKRQFDYIPSQPAPPERGGQ